MAKPPLNGHLLLWGSWVGNALLTLLAAYVVFTHPEPLAPLTILTFAVCILSGNLLPLGAHALLFQWDKLAVTDEHVEGTRSLKSAIALLSETEARLADAREACSKATLVARQVPDRIREQVDALSASLDQIDSKAMATLSDTLSRFNESLTDVSTRLEKALPAASDHPEDETTAATEQEQPILTALSAIQTEMGHLAHSLEELRPAALAADQGIEDETDPPIEDLTEADEGGDPDWSVGEIGMVDFSDDEDEEDNLIAVEDELRPEPELSPEATEAPPESISPDPVEIEPTEISAVETTEADAPEAAEPEPETEAESDNIPPEPPAAPPPPKAAKARKAERAPTSSENELFSEDDLKATAKTSDPAAAVLEIHAMIGIDNTVFLRGDPPHLSWEQGIPLELTGIGEYRWQVTDLDRPLNCKLLLNDERWAIGENVVLEPGQHLSLHPRF